MKTQRFSAANERRCLIGMITRRPVLAALAGSWPKGGGFASKWANVVGGWCVDHLARHDAAPGKAVEGLFSSWAESQEAQGDAATVQLVERFLESLSDEYESEPASVDDGLIDSASGLFNKVGLRNLIEQMQADLDRGDVKAAEEKRSSYQRVEVGAGSMYGVLQDSEGLRTALERAHEPPLVIYPGDLNKFFQQAFVRDALIAFQAPEKRGKSFALIDVAWRAMQQRRGVLFFAAGDMTRPQMHARFAARAAKRPVRARKIQYPTRIYKQDKELFVEAEERDYADPLDYPTAMRAYKEAQERYVRDDSPYLELGCYLAGHLSLGMIKSECLRRQDSNRPVDVVVIDYADLLLQPPGKDEREWTNKLWTQLRALAAQLHCCVVTATQADAESYRKRTQDMHNFSLDKRKNAHVTGMVGINADDAEKGKGVQRWNWLVRRDDEYVSGRWVGVAGCPAISNPALRSIF